MLQEALTSPFILEQIKITTWENRSAIHDLLLLYRLMNKQRLSPAEGQLYFLLRNKYESAYVQLLKENNPMRYQVYLEEQEKMQHQQKEAAIQERTRQQLMVEQEKKEYEWWMALQKRA